MLTSFILQKIASNFNFIFWGAEMKISFEQIQTNHPAEQAIKTYGATQGNKMIPGCGYAVDISGKVMDNNAYGQGRTTEEVMQQLDVADISVMRDYLTVMSHSMSAEDFQKMQQEGFDPSNMEIKESVTILDHIKAALLRGGTVVEGFTTDISSDVLKDVTGSETLSVSVSQAVKDAKWGRFPDRQREIEQTLEEAASLEPLDEAAVKYMVTNELPITIDSLYQAEHSAHGNGNQQGHGYYADQVSGYYAKKADQMDLVALEPQLKKAVEEAELSVSKETMQEAGWLVEKGIPLTRENLIKLHQVNSVELPLSEETIDKAVLSALLDGKETGGGDLTDPRSLFEKAVSYEQDLQSITDKDVATVLEEGQELTLAHLTRAYEKTVENQTPEKIAERQAIDSIDIHAFFENDPAKQTELLHATTVLHRTQLVMTASANLQLLQSGYAIDTAPLEELVSRLEQLEESEKQAFWNTDTIGQADARASLYDKTEQVLGRLASQPAAAMLSFVQKQNSVTLAGLEQEGAVLQKKYLEANQSYETMKSEPRADLGDSIQKAFANVDDILMDLELELHEMNRRAVRILGYNSMDITPELIASVKLMDAELQSVMQRMTPSATLQTIRAGQNPLEMSLEELQEFLDSLPQEEGKKEDSLGKFIYSLEQKKEITDAEKEACIGIYRIFRQIEKKDHRVVGRLVQNGMEPSFKNVIAAMRSEQKKGKEYTVDDSFGGVDAKETGASITAQIAGAFYQSLAGQVVEEAVPDQILHAMETHQMQTPALVEQADTTLEQMVSDILYAESYGEEKKEAIQKYEEQALVEMGEELKVSNETLAQILELELPTTPAYMKAFEQLMQHPDGWYMELLRGDKKGSQADQKGLQSDRESTQADEITLHTEDEDRIADDRKAFLSAMEQGNLSAMNLSYGNLMDSLQRSCQQMMENADGYLDWKAMQSIHKQMHVAAGLGDVGRWDVPVTVQDEDTLIHLTFKKGQNEKGQVDITFTNEKMGKVAARFYSGKNATGYVLCETEEAAQEMEQLKGQLEQLVGGTVSVLKSETIETNQFMDIQKNESLADIEREDVTNKALYRIAAGFIRACS